MVPLVVRERVVCYVFPLLFDQFSLMNVFASLIGIGDLPAFRVLRTLRGLRPLRAMSRMQGLKVSPGEEKG